MNKEIYSKIIAKKEFSKLVKKDVEMAFSKFEKREVSGVEKIRLTRELLHKVYASFLSQKLLSLKDKDEEWILRKHLSTRERLLYYDEIYSRILKDVGKKFSVVDLGCGVNGFSYKFLKKHNLDYYLGVEAVGQLVDLQNNFFKKEKIKGRVFHESLFELEKIKKIVKSVKGKRVLFLFKVVDSLEMLERDYSKKLLLEIVPLVDKVVVSFATRSLVARRDFKVKRFWFENFVKDNFKVLDDFEIGGERYVVFGKRD